MRKHGPLSTPAGLGLRDHACWAFEERAEMVRAGTAYLAEGHRLGQRLMYVGEGDVERLRHDLAGLPQRDALLETGGLALAPVDQVYDLGTPVDAEARVAVYDALVDEALAAGFTGLRVLAEVTVLLVDPAGAAAHARWEAVADRYMDRRPLSALCCYDRGAVDEAALAAVACVHPLAHAPEHVRPFQLFASDGRLALDGEVDYFSAPILAGALAGADAGGDTVLDLEGLRFIDVPGVRALRAERGRLAAQGRELVLRSAPDAVRRLERLLDAS